MTDHFDVNQPITTDEQAEGFYRWLIETQLGWGFHPDDHFVDYVSNETGGQLFPDDLAAVLERRNDEACAVLPDQYATGLRIMEEALK